MANWRTKNERKKKKDHQNSQFSWWMPIPEAHLVSWSSLPLVNGATILALWFHRPDILFININFSHLFQVLETPRLETPNIQLHGLVRVPRYLICFLLCWVLDFSPFFYLAKVEFGFLLVPPFDSVQGMEKWANSILVKINPPCPCPCRCCCPSETPDFLAKFCQWGFWVMTMVLNFSNSFRPSIFVVPYRFYSTVLLHPAVMELHMRSFKFLSLQNLSSWNRGNLGCLGRSWKNAHEWHPLFS